MKKRYIGDGFEHNYGCISVSVKVEELKKLSINEYGEVKFFVAPRKEPNIKSGATHSVFVKEEEATHW